MENAQINVEYLDKNQNLVLASARSMLEEHARNPSLLEPTLETFDLLVEWKLRMEPLLAALMLPITRHDLLSDTRLESAFGKRVPQLSRIANKLILYEGTQEMRKKPPVSVINSRMLRRLFMTAYVDLEAVLICVAARLVDMQHLGRLQKDVERQSWAQKSMSVYVPLLEMLGLWNQRHELGNISLQILHLPLYEEFRKHVDLYQRGHARLFDRIEYELTGQLKEAGISQPQVLMHEITPSGLYRRMQEAEHYGENFSPEDVRTLRIDVLVNTERDCYLTLGIIHKLWTPALRGGSLAEGRFLDYIASPRYNGYRCLITNVLCPEPQTDDETSAPEKLVEFRIHTRDMRHINTYGVVAALRDTEPVPNTWWTNEAVKEALTKRDTKTLSDEMCVFTPNGEVIFPVRRGSTLIDIAFKIHSALGPYARHFWINGVEVANSHELRHRDLIWINYDTHYPSLEPEWEEHARTSTAQQAIRRFIRQRERSPHKGRQSIDRVLQRESAVYQMRFPAEKVEKALERIATEKDCANVDALYMKVLEGQISPDDVVATMIEAELVEHIVRADGEHWPRDRIRIARSWMQEKGERKLDRNLRVIPGAEIVGRLSGESDPSLVVHRKDHHLAPDGDEAVELAWRPVSTHRESSELIITAPPHAAIAGDILSVVNTAGTDNERNGITVHRMQMDIKEGAAHINLVIDAESFDTIYGLQDTLEALKESGKISDFKFWQLFPGQKMLLADRGDRRRHLPYTLRQIRDRAMFFGRDAEISRVVDDVAAGRPFIVLYGQKRIGKTSLMLHLAETILPQTSDVIPITLDAHALAPFTPQTFLIALTEKARQAITQQGSSRQRIPRLKPEDLETDMYNMFARWVAQTQRELKGTRLLFMVDEFTRAEEECERGRLDHSFFDGLQALVDQHQVGFLLCVHDNIYNSSSRSWSMMQRGTPIHLQSLEREPAASLVRQPMARFYRFDDEIVDRILRLTYCHPYFIHALCLEINAFMKDIEDDAVTNSVLERAVTKVLHEGDHYFSHYRAAVDEDAWNMLKTIAYAARNVEEWISYDEIRAAHQIIARKQGTVSMSGRISINHLYRARIIEARTLDNNRVEYRIPVELLQLWLRQRTNPLIAQDMLERD